MSSSLKPLAPLSTADLSKLLGACVDQLNDAIIITEAEPLRAPGPRIIWANKVFYDLTGYTPSEVIGQTPRILQGPETDRAALDALSTALDNWLPSRAELLNYRKDGSTFWNELQIVPIANEKGWYTHWVSIQRNVSERKKIEHEIQQLAFYDALTLLPNRRLLDDRLSQCIAASKRTNIYSALIFLDLDNFKPINDNYGHGIGDKLLVEVASRLKKCTRATDTVSRFGGDEFVVMLSDLSADHETSRAQAAIVAEKIRDVLSQPYLIRNECTNLTVEHYCTVSIGLLIFNGMKDTPEDLIKLADTAMYRAKESGRNQVCFYGVSAVAPDKVRRV